MTSALNAVFGGLTAGTTPAGGFAWYAVVLESFNVNLTPQFNFKVVPHSAGVALTPSIGMSVTTHATTSFRMSFTPKIGILPPQTLLTFTPAMAFTGKAVYGPANFGLTFNIFILMKHPTGKPLQGQMSVPVMRSHTF